MPFVLFFFVFVVAVPLLILKYISDKQKKERLSFCDRCRQVKPDMDKEEIIDLLGDKYTNSHFPDKIEIIEYHYNGQFGPKIWIKLQNGLVIESHGERLDK